MIDRRFVYSCVSLVYALTSTMTLQGQDAAVDPTGTWAWEQQFGGRKFARELTLGVEDGKLTGALKTIGGFRRGPNPPTKISNSKFTGDEISFDVVRRFGNNEFTTTYSGVVSGDEIAGLTITRFGGQDRESAWMAKRVVADENLAAESDEGAQAATEAASSSEASIVRFSGPSIETVNSAKPGRIPVPGPATNEPYQPQPILPGGMVIPLYANGSSALNQERIKEAEKYSMTKGVPGRIQSIVNIHNPSIEIHRADRSTNTGTAVILAAGGGHRTLNVGTEAADFVPYFYNYGINCVILRNRLRSDGYSAEIDAVNDALQAIRVVRAFSENWGIDPNRIGIVGFSAGAELSGPAAIRFEEFDKKHQVTDGPLAGISSRPNFVGLLYPGPTPFTREPETTVPRNAPPSFIATPGSGDRIHAIWAMDYFNAMLRIGVPNIELHVYGNGVHAGGLKDRKGTPLGTWQDRFIDWFRDLGFLSEPGTETKAELDVAAFVENPPRRGRR